jgi:pyroglutamyl-peptidase
LIARERPAIVLCVGLAAERPTISIERVAINLCHARIADTDGRRPRDRPVIVRAAAAYFSTLPVRRIVDALTRAGLAAEMSMSAGTFVCNHVFFSLMHEAALARHKPGVRRAGFVHVPALPARDMPRALAGLVRALQIVLRETQRSLQRRRA